MEKMNVMQLVGKFLGDQIARIYEKIGLHTGDNSIHRTSAEIRAEITEGDIPPEIARQTEVERALAGKVDKIDGKELMPSPGEGLSREYYLNASGQWEKISSDALVITMTVSEDQQHFSLDEIELGAYLKAYYGIDSYEDVRNPDTVHSHIGVFLKYAPYGVKYKEDGTVDNIYTIWNFIKVTRTFTEYGIPHLMAYVSEAGDDGVVTTGYYCQIDIWDRGDGVLRPSVLYSSITSNYMASKNYVDNTKAGKSDLQAHVGNTENPHRVTKSQIGLEHVENTADADKPVSKPVQQALDGIAGQLQSHAADAAIHRTSAQIRAEITDADIPGTIARDADVDTKIQAHNESGEAHADLRNALANLESGTVEAGSAVYAQKLGTAADSYTKTQLDAKLNRHIKDVVYDAGHAKFTFVFEDGREIVVDTPLENTVTDGRYDNETLELVLVLVSGQEIRIPVAGMTKVYTGKDTATATTTINDAGEVSVAVKTGGIDAVHLSGALLSAINSHLTSTGDTKDNITTFPDQVMRTNLASGDKHAVLFGKIKRWFSDLKTVAFTGKASDLSQDTSNRLVTDAEKAGWNDKYTRAEVDTKDAGKANLVHTHTKAQITDFPTALPANGGNADTVDGYHAIASQDVTVANMGDKIPVYDTNGYLSAVVFRDNWTREDNQSIAEICYRFSQEDGYHRWCSVGKLKGVLGSMPASDVYAWAKQANKPTYNINEIYDADGVRVDAGTVNRKIFIANYKSEGYLSRAAIGLTNPIAAFSPVIISAGMDDQGNTWADWTFDPATGRITNPSGKAFAYTEEIPNVSNYLPLSGGAMAGMLSTCMMPSTFIEGMTRAAIKYNDLTAITNTAYHSFFAMKAQNNHILNFGGIGNDIGFRGYLGGRAQNGYDYRLSCNTADGSWTLEKGRFYIDGSAPEHVIMFRHYGVNTGYIGFGAYPTKDLQIMNYATGRYINIAADGKLYYNNKEIATVDQITGGTIPDASTSVSGIVNTKAQEFSGRKAFRGGIDITSGGMTVNGGIAVTNGTIACTGEISAANGFFVDSDKRLKKNIAEIKLNKRIKLYEFDLGGKLGYGVIAQEIEPLYPSAVIEKDNGYKAVNYTEILVIKCAEQDERIEALERENSSLKERLERLEKLLLK